MIKRLYFILATLLTFTLGYYFQQPLFATSIDEEINQISQKIADLEKSIAPLKKETTDISEE